MIYFPHNPFKRVTVVNPLVPVRSSVGRDILWNKPVFKAPALSNPPFATEPLPFTAARVTQRAR